MTRMTRELSLVLLGAGVLTAGYFLAPVVWAEDDPAQKADEETLAAVGGQGHQGHSSAGYHRPHGFMHFVYLPIAGGRYGSQSAAAVPRGGFGAVAGGYSAAS